MPDIYDPRVNIVEEQRFLGLHKDGMRSPLLKNQLGSKKRTVEMDSTGQNINFTEKLGDFDYMLANYLSLEDYVQSRRDYKIRDAWIQNTVSKLSETTTGGGKGGGFRIDIPVEIKSRAFQKIFGTGTVGLDVSGEITIKGGFRNEKRSEVKSALNRGSDNSFKMEQTQRFQVQGRIGDKVTIGIDQDSERTFDFDNNISLKYKGYEDEVIQSLEAGNIALSLPGTQFVTFGGKSNGLFGIKTAATIGNLKLTAIASQEKGEKKKLSLKGGATEEASRIEDSQYKRGIYYFIDEYYRDNYTKRSADGYLISYPDREITKYEVYKAGPGFQQKYTESIRGWAFVPDPADSDTLILANPDTTTETRSLAKGYFIRLVKNVDYDIDERLGYIRLRQRLADDEILAIAYKDSTKRERGTITVDSDTKLLYLRMLKNKDPRPADKTWKLEWKNVYDFGRGTPKDGFEMRIFYKPPSGDPQETVEVNGVKQTWLEFFGLDKKNLTGENTPDNLVDDNPVLINFSTGEVFFPDLRPFDPVGQALRDKYKKEYLAPALYDTTVQSVINAQSHFYIEVNSKRSSSQYSLGMNVIEKSEEVTLNGRRLTAGTDYNIDYFSGQLRILNEEALASNANLEVSYESNQLFQIDKKTVMGARAEYGLGGDSFIGATFLYLNERTLDQKVRVGKGPMRNMVWDINTSLSAEPYFLTRMANLLPFVDTRAASSIKFEGEFAQIIPNPNTQNNEHTGDNDGVAYIDDFEATKRITPISIMHQSWEYCSPPVGKYFYEPKEKRTLANRSGMFYFTPYSPYPIANIWPNRDLNANVNKTTNILVMEYTPVDTIPGVDIKESWNGIQKWLSSGYSNQTETKFIEVWVWGNTGTIHIDLGQISEDIIPNGRYDTEDKMVAGIRNALLDDNEDIGLDGMANNDPAAIKAGGDFWDLNNNGIKDAGEPFSNDDYSYNVKIAENEPTKYSRVNGTEGNKDSGGLRIPDTEDLNGNGDVDMTNNYYEYTFSLDKSHADTMFISGKSISNTSGEDYGWRQYRIPIKAPDSTLKKIGSPDLSLIEYIRVWADGFETPGTHVIQIAEINLVGSDWKEMGVSSQVNPDSFVVENDTTVTITVVNSHDNPEYKAPPGVQGEVDRITRVIAKEQSMVLMIDKLQPGYTGIVEKTFYEAQDYINYKTFKMFIYGKDPYSRHMVGDSSKIEFFLRMGADKNNYYEIRQPVYEGWKSNNVEVDLIALSQLKVSADSSWEDPENPGIKFLYKDLGNGRSWTVKGKPALRNIRMLIAGVKNKGYGDRGVGKEALLDFSGEVWMNEMRLSNVKKDKGIALRSRLDFNLADLVRFNGEVNKKDADFHNVAQRFGTGDNEISGSFSTSVSVEKFLPAKLGLSLPVSVNYAKSEATPKYIPGTDVEINKNLPEATLDSLRTIDEKKGMSVSFGVTSRSQNFFVKQLLTKLKASYSRNESEGSDSRTLYRTSMSESGSMTWGVAFGTTTFIKPFKWIGPSRFLMKLSDMKLYYAPQTITTSHSGARNINESMTRSGVSSENRSFILNRSYGLSMKITDALSYDVKRGYVHDVRGMNKVLLQEQLDKGKLGLLTSIDNSLSLKYAPQIFSWFTPNFTYTTGFKYGFNRQQSLAPRSATQNRALQASGNLNMGTLFKAVYRPGAKGPKTSGAPPGRTAPGAVPGAAPAGAQQKSGEKKFHFSTMGIVSGFFTAFDPFSVSYNTRDNVSTYGITGMPNANFQLGFSKNPGVGIEQALTGSSASTSSTASFNRGSSTINNTTSVSSGINISRDISLKFKYDDSYSLNANGKTTTGQRSKSWMKIGESDMMFPNWTISWRSVEKLLFLNKYFQRVSLEHNFSGKSNETFDVVQVMGKNHEKPTKEDKDFSFRPLIGVTMSMKNGISMSVRYNTSEKEAKNTSYGNAVTRNTTSDISVTGSYSKNSNFRIPLPFLRNKKLKNKVDVAMTVSVNTSKQEDSKDKQEFQVKAETSKWFLKPDVNYSFSDRVTGGMFFEIGKTHNKMTGDTSYKEFGLNVSIQIRGN